MKKRKNEIKVRLNANVYSADIARGIITAFINPEKPLPNETEFLAELGYRKASEVAREIFEEIDKMLDPYGRYLKILRLGEYAELKKKYTEGEE